MTTRQPSSRSHYAASTSHGYHAEAARHHHHRAAYHRHHHRHHHPYRLVPSQEQAAEGYPQQPHYPPQEHAQPQAAAYPAVQVTPSSSHASLPPPTTTKGRSSGSYTSDYNAPPAVYASMPSDEHAAKNGQVVQQIVVDWTAELDQRLLKWVAHVGGNDWETVAQNLRLPTFVCQHRYSLLQARNKQVMHPIPPALVRPPKRNKTWCTAETSSGKMVHTYVPPRVVRRPAPRSFRPPHRVESSASYSSGGSVVSRSYSSDAEDMMRGSSHHKRKLPLTTASRKSPKTTDPHKNMADTCSTTATRTNVTAVAPHAPETTRAVSPSQASATSQAGPVAKRVTPPSTKTVKQSVVRPCSTSGSESFDHVDLEPEEPMAFFRIFRQGAPECLGFLTLSVEATFADVRQKIAEDLESVPDDGFQFLLDTLGPVSRKQEHKLGPIMDWLATDDVHAGTRQSPVRLEIVSR